jgi:hypothetical protein
MLYGIGCKVDIPSAVSWLEQAAEEEMPMAQFSIATFSATGIGMAQSVLQCKTWLRRLQKIQKGNDYYMDHACALLELSDERLVDAIVTLTLNDPDERLFIPFITRLRERRVAERKKRTKLNFVNAGTNASSINQRNAFVGVSLNKK